MVILSHYWYYNTTGTTTPIDIHSSSVVLFNYKEQGLEASTAVELYYPLVVLFMRNWLMDLLQPTKGLRRMVLLVIKMQPREGGSLAQTMVNGNWY